MQGIGEGGGLIWQQQATSNDGGVPTPNSCGGSSTMDRRGRLNPEAAAGNTVAGSGGQREPTQA
eukprot:11459710-Alexandrium_andersonii.AAC.1